ncbi:MAG: glycosyltransferase family 39 protein [Oscillospiraceae bacterium]
MIKTLKKDTYSRVQWAVLAVALLVGIVSRVLLLSKFPAGMNPDEASLGYDMYSLLKYGIDRNGVAFPPYLVAWGSGQSVAYGLLCLPFLAIFGLCEFAVRFPMALVGCISLFVFFGFLYNIADKKIALIGTCLLAISPWFIMKSRWGLDCNLLPDLILWAVFCVVLFIKSKKSRYLYLGFAIFAFAAYAYAVAYIFLPLLVLPIVFIMFRKKQIKLHQGIIAFGIMGVILIPIFSFLAVNYLGLEPFKLGFMEIPRLTGERVNEIVFFSDNIIKQLVRNIKSFADVFFLQNDQILRNVMPSFGVVYNFSTVFMVVGVLLGLSKINLKKDKQPKAVSTDNGTFVVNVWMIASIILAVIVTACVSKIGVLWFPYLYFTAVGINFIYEKCSSKTVIVGILATYILFFGMFTVKYFNSYQREVSTDFYTSVKEPIKLSQEYDVPKVYFKTDATFSGYIEILFYTRLDPNLFAKTAFYGDSSKAAYRQPATFDKYVTDLPQKIEKTEKAVYIIQNQYTKEFSETDFNIYEYEYYSLAVPKFLEPVKEK